MLFNNSNVLVVINNQGDQLNMKHALQKKGPLLAKKKQKKKQGDHDDAREITAV